MHLPDAGASVHVAFFRNMNLGQVRSKSPTSLALVQAFADAGAEQVRNFQTNGTVVFQEDDPASVLAGVRPVLAGLTGYSDTVVTRPAGWLLGLADRLDATLPAGEVVLFDASTVPELELPWREPAQGLLTILELDEWHAVTSWSAVSPGSSSNTVLAGLVGLPVTCRGVPTMLRLAQRLRTG